MASISKEDLLKLMNVGYLGFVAYKKLLYNKNKNRRRWWVREIYSKRKSDGFYETTFKIMKERDRDSFFNTFCMSPERFDVLLGLLEDHLRKNSIRQPIIPECRLALTLMYLAHGGRRSVYAWKFKMGISTVRIIILDTCEAIWKELSEIFFNNPKTNEWLTISSEFQEMWKIPNCIGAIDGKIINIVYPSKKKSVRQKVSKGGQRVVLMGASDANSTFTAFNIISYSSQNENKLYKFEDLFDGLALPSPKQLPNSTEELPHYFVVDIPFTLKFNVMRPYPLKNLTPQQRNYNNRLSRAMLSIENAFGVMVSRWQVLRGQIHCGPENVDKIIRAVIVLHNYLKRNDKDYCPHDYADHLVDGTIISGAWRTEGNNLKSGCPFNSNNASRTAFILRDKLCNYLFESE